MPAPRHRKWRIGPGLAGRTGLYDGSGNFLAEFHDPRDAVFAVFAERNLETLIRGLRDLVISVQKKTSSPEVDEARHILEMLGTMFFPTDRVQVNAENGDLWFIGTVENIVQNGVEVRADDNDELFSVACEQLTLLPKGKR